MPNLPKHTTDRRVRTRVEGITYDIALQLETCETQIVAKAQSIGREMNRVIESVEAGQSTNALGALQGNAAAFDILLAKRQLLADTLRTLTWAATEDEKEAGANA